MEKSTLNTNRTELTQFISLLSKEDEICELRAFDVSGKPMCYRFKDRGALVEKAAELNAECDVYIVTNPISPEHANGEVDSGKRSPNYAGARIDRTSQFYDESVQSGDVSL